MRNGSGGGIVRSRDALLVAVGLLVGGAAVFLLTFPPGGGGGMMGGMGGMMGGLVLGVLFVAIAAAFVVVAVFGSAAKGASLPTPLAAPPLPPSVAPLPPPAPPPVVTSEVEAAVVRMLDEDERLLYLRIRDTGGAVVQRDVVGWGTFSAAKVTRLLDRLERKGLVVRERSGLTNRIRLTRQPISGK